MFTENNSTKTNYRAFPSTLKITRNDAELYTKLLFSNRKHTATGKKKHSAFEKRFKSCMSFTLDFQKNYHSKIYETNFANFAVADCSELANKSFHTALE